MENNEVPPIAGSWSSQEEQHILEPLNDLQETLRYMPVHMLKFRLDITDGCFQPSRKFTHIYVEIKCDYLNSEITEMLHLAILVLIELLSCVCKLKITQHNTMGHKLSHHIV